MTSVEERMKILKMIEEGKISAEEGAKLLAALRDARRGPGHAASHEPLRPTGTHRSASFEGRYGRRRLPPPDRSPV